MPWIVAAALNKRLVELYQAGKFSEAMPLAQRALAIWEKALGPDHPDVATSLNNLAKIYRRQGRYTDAEPLNRRALAISRKRSVPTIPMSRYRSTTWLGITQVAMRTPTRSTSERWRSARRRSVPNTPMSH
jgi:tetratricopeptide (TPR) repeat protein